MPDISAEQLDLLQRAARGEELSQEERVELDRAVGKQESEEPPKRRCTKEQIAAWEKIYDTKQRQLHRYLKTGEDRNDPCPLDNPAAMPAWWSRNMRHTVPPKISAAAERARAAAPQPAAAPAAPTIASADISAPAAPQTPPIDPVNLSTISMSEGEEVRQARTLVKAAYERLEKAYKGEGGDVDLLQRRWEKAQDALRKAKAQEELHKRQSEDLVPIVEIQSDLAKAADLLRRMHETMIRRVRELCPDLPAEHWEKVARAIENVRTQEAIAFRSLAKLKTPEDVFSLIAA